MAIGKNLAIGCLAVVLLVICIAGAIWYSHYKEGNRKLDQAGEYVLKALNIKYNKEFVIVNGHYIYNTNAYEFTVHPKNDPEFTFNAWLNGMTESGESDMYFLALRTEQGKRLISPFIKAISNDYYIDAVGSGPNPKMKNYDEALANVHHNMLSIDQQLKAYPYEIVIDARVNINYNITPANEDEVLKKVYNLVNFLKEKKFGSIELRLYFYDFPNKNLQKMAKEDVNFSLDYRFQAPIWIYITPQDIPNIKNYKEIKKYFIYMKEGKEVNKNEQ